MLDALQDATGDDDDDPPALPQVPFSAPLFFAAAQPPRAKFHWPVRLVLVSRATAPKRRLLNEAALAEAIAAFFPPSIVASVSVLLPLPRPGSAGSDAGTRGPLCGETWFCGREVGR